MRNLKALGCTFRTRTDTEVIAAACEHFGIDGALRRMNGMWAFVWVDLERSQIFIARDRFGVKPLYLYARNGMLAFASEIKTLVRALRLRCAVNVGAVSTFLRASLVDTNDATFFEGIVKLTPGHYAQVDAVRGALSWQTTRYWSLPEAVAGIAPLSDVDAAEEVRRLLEDAVRLRLRSDVPVGLLLSGGLDSSAIAAVAGAQLAADDNLTFISAVSDDATTDESAFIRIVARHLSRPVQEVRLEFPRRQDRAAHCSRY